VPAAEAESEAVRDDANKQRATANFSLIPDLARGRAIESRLGSIKGGDAEQGLIEEVQGGAGASHKRSGNFLTQVAAKLLQQGLSGLLRRD